MSSQREFISQLEKSTLSSETLKHQPLLEATFSSGDKETKLQDLTKFYWQLKTLVFLALILLIMQGKLTFKITST